MAKASISLVSQTNRVPSMTVDLSNEDEKKYQEVMEGILMVDMHEHPMVFPENMDHFIEYLRDSDYEWGYEAAKHGGWSTVATANGFRGGIKPTHASSAEFDTVLDEIGIMLADMSLRSELVTKVQARMKYFLPISKASWDFSQQRNILLSAINCIGWMSCTPWA